MSGFPKAVKVPSSKYRGTSTTVDNKLNTEKSMVSTQVEDERSASSTDLHRLRALDQIKMNNGSAKYFKEKNTNGKDQPKTNSQKGENFEKIVRELYIEKGKLPFEFIERLPEFAVFDPESDDAKEWINGLKEKYDSLISNNQTPMRARINAYLEMAKKYKMRYEPDEFGVVNFPQPTIVNIQRATETVQRKLGDCEDFSLLFAASLAELGQDYVIILSQRHVIPALITTVAKARKEELYYLKLSKLNGVKSDKVIIPIDVAMDYKPELTMRNMLTLGVIAYKENSGCLLLNIVSSSGEIIFPPKNSLFSRPQYSKESFSPSGLSFF